MHLHVARCGQAAWNMCWRRQILAIGEGLADMHLNFLIVYSLAIDTFAVSLFRRIILNCDSFNVHAVSIEDFANLFAHDSGESGYEIDSKGLQIWGRRST